MISIACGKKYKKTMAYLNKLDEINDPSFLEKYGQKGVDALYKATPKDTGKTANSWSYRIENNGKRTSIIWENSNYNKGVPIALVIQYGHATPSGAYIAGIDYINPAMKPIFDEIVEDVRKELKSK